MDGGARRTAAPARSTCAAPRARRAGRGEAISRHQVGTVPRVPAGADGAQVDEQPRQRIGRTGEGARQQPAARPQRGDGRLDDRRHDRRAEGTASAARSRRTCRPPRGAWRPRRAARRDRRARPRRRSGAPARASARRCRCRRRARRGRPARTPSPASRCPFRRRGSPRRAPRSASARPSSCPLAAATMPAIGADWRPMPCSSASSSGVQPAARSGSSTRSADWASSARAMPTIGARLRPRHVRLARRAPPRRSPAAGRARAGRR